MKILKAGYFLGPVESKGFIKSGMQNFQSSISVVGCSDGLSCEFLGSLASNGGTPETASHNLY